MSLISGLPPVHVSEVLKDWILPKGMSVTEIARRLGVSRQSVDALLNKRRQLTWEMAKRIEIAFGGNARLMMNVQAAWDQAKIEARASELAEQVTPVIRSKAS